MSKLRVWHIPQVPMKAFRVEVESLEESVKVLDILADYDLFQFENRVKPDYCNAQGLEEWDDQEGKWYEWCNEDGLDIKEYREELEKQGDVKMEITIDINEYLSKEEIKEIAEQELRAAFRDQFRKEADVERVLTVGGVTPLDLSMGI